MMLISTLKCISTTNKHTIAEFSVFFFKKPYDNSRSKIVRLLNIVRGNQANGLIKWYCEILSIALQYPLAKPITF